jgi:hypothetical protein
VPVGQKEFDADSTVMGPILLAGDGERHQALLAYEHGSMFPDAYLGSRSIRSPVALRAVKGNYLAGHPIGPDGSFERLVPVRRRRRPRDDLAPRTATSCSRAWPTRTRRVSR